MRDAMALPSTGKRAGRDALRTLDPLAVVLMAVLAWSCASSAWSSEPKKILSRTALAQTFVIGSGDPALALQVDVVDGKVASVVPAAADQGNVAAVRSDGEGQVMLSLATTLDVTLKFDLYVSSDGLQFEYTSTCAVTPGISGFEMWQRPVREFALGNPRVLAKGKMPCD